MVDNDGIEADLRGMQEIADRRVLGVETFEQRKALYAGLCKTEELLNLLGHFDEFVRQKVDAILAYYNEGGLFEEPDADSTPDDRGG